MININTYVNKFGNKTFVEMPFNDVDGFILAELSMINFEHLLDKRSTMALKDIIIANYKKVIYGSPDSRANGVMLKRMMASKRFQNLKVGFPKRMFGEEVANQFYAVTFILPDDTVYISFRGTDITLVGWKEDFYLTFMDDIPSYYQALEYTESIFAMLPDNKFIVGGHSKGGHLAFYAALNMKPEYCKRLIKAISYDGPGFRNGIEGYLNYESVKDKLKKYLTHRDLVGMVYTDIPNTTIVYSTGVLLGGHDPFTWKLDSKTGEYITREKRTKRSENFMVATNMWLKEMSHEDKLLGCEALFKIVGKAQNIYDLLRYLGPNIARFNSVVKTFPKQQQQRLRELIQMLLKCMKIAKKTPQKADNLI